MRYAVSFLAGWMLLGTYCSLAQDTFPIEIQADQPYAEIPATLWGVFFQDVNFAADGGLHAELVKNGSFEFADPMKGWEEQSGSGAPAVQILNRGADSSDMRFIRVVPQKDSLHAILLNRGFRGMGIRKDEFYPFSFWARQDRGTLSVTLQIVGVRGDTLGEVAIPIESDNWKYYEGNIQADTTDARAALRVVIEGTGTADLDRVSLRPQHTWRKSTIPLRQDLMAILEALKPGFFRFPGGALVGGKDLQNGYQWKETLGPLPARKTKESYWNNAIHARQTTDYYQSFALGFFEYFVMAEALGAAPFPVVNAGMACPYQTGEIVELQQMEPYIQNVLDLIEFANGDATTPWGHVRASLGHPASFNLKFIGVGYDHEGPSYVGRYQQIARAVHQKYPQIQLMAGTGAQPTGSQYTYLSEKWQSLNVPLVEHHAYEGPLWFLNNARRYDTIPRTGTKVAVGAYAAHTQEGEDPESANNWGSALAEAAFMIGLERNADLVSMASYAPLLAHREAWQWRPCLIWFDNLNVIVTPNYYIQKMFSCNKGTQVVPAVHHGKVLSQKDELHVSAVIDQDTQELIVKIVNTQDTMRTVLLDLKGITVKHKKTLVQTLWSSNLTDYNSLKSPYRVVPVTRYTRLKRNKVNILLGPYSFTLLRIPFQPLADDQ